VVDRYTRRLTYSMGTLSDSVPVRGVLVLAAMLFFMMQVSLFGDLHNTAGRLALKVDNAVGCSLKFRALVNENAALTEKVLELEHALHLPALSSASIPTSNRTEGSGAGVLSLPGKARDVLLGQVPKLSRGDLTSQIASLNKPISLPPAQQLPAPTLPQVPRLAPLSASNGPIAAVVVMACNRPDYLQRTLDSILRVNPSTTNFPVFVSQDGTDARVAELARRYEGRVSYMQHIEERPPRMKSPKEEIVYYRIADHYRWAFEQLFDERHFPRVIVLEDDMELAVDFFQYFKAMAPLLDNDPTLWCVSSWNDNGQDMFVADPKAVFRSDFFPGLGWMLTKNMWDELHPIWTTGPSSIPGVFGGYWDDWMRNNEVRKGRQCIRPEVCRTANFGEKGSSKGQFFKEYLTKIHANTEMVDWSEFDLSTLDATRFNINITGQMQSATMIHDAHQALTMTGDVRIQYNSKQHFEALAKAFNIMPEWKAGVPRGSYRGIVIFRVNSGAAKVFLGPGPGIRLHDEGYIIPPLGGRP